MRVAALLSGGVDSSVALYLLKQAGHDVTAFYLKVWMEDDMGLGDCAWQTDVDYCRQVTARLGIPFEIVPMQKEYWERVVSYTLEEVKSGRTPNPDMMCNRLIKFGAFHEKFGTSFDKIGSGHYARIAANQNGRSHLMLSADRRKDQTYFLSQMSYEQIERSLFPLSDRDKRQVRKIAAELALPNARRKDSQGICFLGKINFRDFLKKYVGTKEGKIVEKASGKILGTHEGYWFYTIGQRNGLGLNKGPWYVLEKDATDNVVFVAHASAIQSLEKRVIKLEKFNWLNDPPGFRLSDHLLAGKSKGFALPVHFKIRHTPELSPGSLCFEYDELFIKSNEPVSGVAAGQFGVIYYEEECLGGGVISD
jgi:tRNA (5-methylaminomethyl-2-thiouridylate)-methyltransferase